MFLTLFGTATVAKDDVNRLSDFQVSKFSDFQISFVKVTSVKWKIQGERGNERGGYTC